MGARVLVTGMGGELGTRVTNLFEADDSIEAIAGLDFDPPRRRVPLATFHRVDPRDRRRTVQIVRDFDPTIVVHLGVYEPNARSSPATAQAATAACAVNVLGAAARCPSLSHIIVRSGTEVYGRRRGAASRPDETVTPDPTSAFGRSLLGVEAIAGDAGRAAAVPVTSLRFAPVVGPHFPSPLGRYLRLPIVPVGALSGLPFSLLHLNDAADAVIAATDVALDGALNVVGSGAVTAAKAVLMGGRVPLPVIGPGWSLASRTTGLWGAPLPGHVRELIVRGRGADGSLAGELAGIRPSFTTAEVVKELYDWAEVVYLEVASRPAA